MRKHTIKAFVIMPFNFLLLRKLIVLFVLSPIIKVGLYGQSKVFFDKGHRIEQYAANAGVPKWMVGDIIQDDKGYLWMANVDYLLRYDGNQFKKYKPKTNVKKGIGQLNRIQGIASDNYGLIWIVTGRGLVRFNPETEIFEEIALKKENESIFCDTGTRPPLKKDENGNLWGISNCDLVQIKPTPTSYEIVFWEMPTITMATLTKVDSLINTGNRWTSLFPNKNNFEGKQPFEIQKENETFIVVNQGEYMGQFIDVGWIEDKLGNIVWESQLDEIIMAGGANKNFIHIDTIQLDKGNYFLKYKTDYSHAYPDWNGPPPVKEEWWGIQLVKTDERHTKELLHLLAEKPIHQFPMYSSVMLPFISKTGVVYCFGSDGIFKITTKGSIHFDYFLLPDLVVNGEIGWLTTRKAGGIWINTVEETHEGHIKQRLFQFDLTSLKSKEIQHGLHREVADRPYMSIMKEDTNGNLWIGSTGMGLYKLRPPFIEIADTITEPIINYINYSQTSKGRLNYGLVEALFEDSHNNMWVGTQNEGVFKIPVQKENIDYFDVLKYTNQGRGSGIGHIFKDTEETLWISLRNGSFLEKKKNGDVIQHNNEFKGVSLAKINRNHTNTYAGFYDDKEGLWFGGQHQLIYQSYTTKQVEIFTLPKKGGNFPIYKIIEDQKERLWIKKGRELFLFDKKMKSFLSNIPLEKNISQIRITNIIPDKKNGLWLILGSGYETIYYGVERNGVYEIEYQTNLNELCYDYQLDANENLWIASAAGLYKIDRIQDSIRLFAESDGLKNNQIWNLAFDKEQKIWVNNSEGIYQFDPITERFETFEQLAGFIQPDYSSSNTFFKDAQDHLIIVDNIGVLRFDPQKIVKNSKQPRISILKTGTKDQIVSLENKEESETIPPFRYHQNDIFFEFIGIGFTSANKNIYQYQLSGIDKNWVQAGTENIARYPNLPPGNYTFKVKAANADGIWSEPKELNITIRPPWWQTKLAYFLYTLAVLAAFWQYRKSYHQRLSKKEQELAKEQELTQRLKATDKLKDEFLANTSHELRTPLNGIIGIAESLKDGIAGNLPTIAITNLDIITSSGKRLSNLINDILDFSKLKNRALTLHKKPIDLHSAVDVVINLTKPLTKGKDLELVNDISSDLPLAEADENRLQQILHNLVGNAVKFTEKGKVRIEAASQNGHLKIAIKDEGIGIETDKLHTIFNSFEQADASATRQYGGTGLGLSITKQLVELHGGTIEATSKIGEGSTFTFTLPKSNADKTLFAIQETATIIPSILPTIKTAPTLAVADLNAPKTGARVLVVDDEPVNLQVLENHLSLANYQVTKANDGEEALALIRASKEPFEIIILDVMMPKMSGYEVCQELRTLYPSSQLPVVMLTAKNRINNLVEGFTSGANDYLTKPFSKDELLTRIKTHLELASINKAYGRFVPYDFLTLLGKDNIIDTHLGDQVKQEMIVLFSDIRAYTTMSENMTPDENFKFINAYLSRVGPVINKNKGFVNQYLGDGIMALFTQSPENALTAAIEMQEEIRRYNADRLFKGRPPIKVGIGLHSGELMLGIIGDANRNDTGVISDAVNTASRMEGLTKIFGSNILLSGRIVNSIDNRKEYSLRYLGKVKIKGKEKVVAVYECFDGDAITIKRMKQETLTSFEKGIQHYFAQEFIEAASVFKKVLTINKADQSAQFYLERAAQYLVRGVPENWDGVVKMTEK